jgi:hypothetical protein
MIGILSRRPGDVPGPNSARGEISNRFARHTSQYEKITPA